MSLNSSSEVRYPDTDKLRRTLGRAESHLMAMRCERDEPENELRRVYYDEEIERFERVTVQPLRDAYEAAMDAVASEQ